MKLIYFKRFINIIKINDCKKCMQSWFNLSLLNFLSKIQDQKDIIEIKCNKQYLNDETCKIIFDYKNLWNVNENKQIKPIFYSPNFSDYHEQLKEISSKHKSFAYITRARNSNFFVIEDDNVKYVFDFDSGFYRVRYSGAIIEISTQCAVIRVNDDNMVINTSCDSIKLNAKARENKLLSKKVKIKSMQLSFADRRFIAEKTGFFGNKLEIVGRFICISNKNAYTCLYRSNKFCLKITRDQNENIFTVEIFDLKKRLKFSIFTKNSNDNYHSLTVKGLLSINLK